MNNFDEELKVFKFARMLAELLQRGVSEEDFTRMGEKLYFSASRHAGSWKRR